MKWAPCTLTGGDVGGKLIETKEGKLTESSSTSGGAFGKREIEEFSITLRSAQCRSLDYARMILCSTDRLWPPGMMKSNRSRAVAVLSFSPGPFMVVCAQALPTSWLWFFPSCSRLFSFFVFH